MLSKLRNQDGLAILEMALIMPLILVFLMLIVDAGLLFFNGVSATNAVREGARCAVVGHTETAIQDRVTEASTMGDPTTVTIEAFEEDGTPIPTWTDATVGDDLVVTATYDHPWILPVDTIVDGITTFTRTARMRVEVTSFDDPVC
ncbi:MAG: TadE/TadG family type IV pilus assembly protein [Chloroflexi bacterium]|nr:TadE/TadG family type IV pilus assembly protein [Chloroflexota bacterium]